MWTELFSETDDVDGVESSQFEIVFTRISPHPTPLPCETSTGPITETYVYFLPQNVPRRAPVARGVANAVIVADHLSGSKYITAAAPFYSSFQAWSAP
jgi:hypothetical protein